MRMWSVLSFAMPATLVDVARDTRVASKGQSSEVRLDEWQLRGTVGRQATPKLRQPIGRFPK